MRTITVCVYEEPAARHLIDDWRESQRANIRAWDRATPFPQGITFEIVQMFSGEVLIILPSINGALSERAYIHADHAIKNDTGRINKLLCFGKVPVRDNVWQHICRVAAQEGG